MRYLNYMLGLLRPNVCICANLSLSRESAPQPECLFRAPFDMISTLVTYVVDSPSAPNIRYRTSRFPGPRDAFLYSTPSSIWAVFTSYMISLALINLFDIFSTHGGLSTSLQLLCKNATPACPDVSFNVQHRSCGSRPRLISCFSKHQPKPTLPASCRALFANAVAAGMTYSEKSNSSHHGPVFRRCDLVDHVAHVACVRWALRRGGDVAFGWHDVSGYMVL